MKKSTVYALMILAAILLVLIQFFVCKPCAGGAWGKKAAAATTAVASKGAVGAATATATGFMLKGANGWSVNCPNGSFTKNDYKLVNKADVSTECLTKIKEYQAKNPKQGWVVTGFYGEDETNSTIYKNLGEARANNIKGYLVNEMNIPSNNIEIASKLVGAGEFDNDVLKNGYLISKGKTISNDTKYTRKFNSLKPIMLRFNTGSNIPLMNETIRGQFSDLIADLEHFPDARLNVVGHTDSVGDANANMALGQRRADQVKDYLVQNGIPASKISTSSQGENQPISQDNAENRRVEVSIK